MPLMCGEQCAGKLRTGCVRVNFSGPVTVSALLLCSSLSRVKHISPDATLREGGKLGRAGYGAKTLRKGLLARSVLTPFRRCIACLAVPH